MKSCKLKNDAVVPLILVKSTMLNIKNLEEKNSMQASVALYELGKIACDPNHKLFSGAADILKSMSLLNDDNTLHDTVRNVAKSAICFEEEGVYLQNPISEVLGEDSSCFDQTTEQV